MGDMSVGVGGRGGAGEKGRRISCKRGARDKGGGEENEGEEEGVIKEL